MSNSSGDRSPISSRVTRLSGTGLTEVFILAATRKTTDLAIGTPRYPQPPAVMLDEVARVVAEGRNQYEHPAGDIVLRQRIAETFSTPADPERELVITAGATEALYVALTATVDTGDEVILFTPGFDQFFSAVDLVGATPRYVSLHGPDWRWDSAELAAAFTSRTRAVVLNTPSNPTGRVLTRQELDEIAELAARWNVTVICDEVYSAYTFDGRPHISVADVPGLAERSIVVGSLSKTFAVSGWRLGFLRADARRTEAFMRVHQLTTLGTAVPLQVAAGRAAAAVDLRTACTQMEQRRDVAQDVFSRLGMKFAPSEGGCYIFADISPLTGGTTDSLSYVRALLDRTGVLLAPGTAFYADPAQGEQYVRIAFNRPLETLRLAERQLLGA